MDSVVSALMMFSTPFSLRWLCVSAIPVVGQCGLVF